MSSSCCIVFVTIALIGVVLIQRSEGGGLGLGGGQGMGSFMTGRGTANLLTRTTAVLGTAFFALSLVSGAAQQRQQRQYQRRHPQRPGKQTAPAGPAVPAPAPRSPAVPAANPGRRAPGDLPQHGHAFRPPPASLPSRRRATRLNTVTPLPLFLRLV